MAYEKNVYFYVKKNEKKYEMEMILDIQMEVNEKNIPVIKKNGKFSYLDYLKKTFTKEHIIKSNNDALKERGNVPEYLLLKEDEVEIAEPVMIYKKTKWIPGEYEAHEYNKFVPGRGRQVMYTNGYSEYEIQCLDKKLKVADGYWEEFTSNGMGDNFEPSEILEEIKAPDITTRLKEGLR